MQKKKILIIEDEEDILALISYHLLKEGFDTITATSGQEGLSLIRTQLPQLVILDWMLPDANGLELCKKLRSDTATAKVPILMVTAKSEETDMILGLETGADDYLTKPFSPKVLVARAKALLRRQTIPQTERTPLQVSGLTIDPSTHGVTDREASYSLTTTEFKVLHFLAQKPDWVFSRYQIVEAIRGEAYIVTDRTVDVLMVSLRKKLKTHGALLETVRGAGYRLKKIDF